jgi:hypothetical protein
MLGEPGGGTKKLLRRNCQASRCMWWTHHMLQAPGRLCRTDAQDKRCCAKKGLRSFLPRRSAVMSIYVPAYVQVIVLEHTQPVE